VSVGKDLDDSKLYFKEQGGDGEYDLCGDGKCGDCSLSLLFVGWFFLFYLF